MLTWLKGLFAKSCDLCKKTTRSPRMYLDERGKRVKVCELCVTYAERRAFRKG
jgi:hypothetical protein